MKIYNDREFPGILRYRDQFSPITVPVLFSGTNFLWYRYRYFFPGPNFFGTGTGTFFRDQFFTVPVPVLFSGTNFFRYRYRYLQNGAKFPGPGIPGTGMSQSGANHPHRQPRSPSQDFKVCSNFRANCCQELQEAL